MTKKLSIIVPFYRESVQQLSIVLSSINNQIGIDFSQIDVHLISDGVQKINPDVFFVFGNIELIYHELPQNVGLGMARQYGIDHSTGEYIMFMDADDELHFAGALLEFFNVIKYRGEHQLIIASYIEQYKDWQTGEFRYYTHPSLDWKMPTAKWYRRAYLNEVGLRFHPDLRTYEETYFVHLACILTTDIYYLDSVVYSWLWNPNSIVRSDGNTFEHQLHIWARARRYFFEFLVQKRPDLMKREIDGYMIYTFFQYDQYKPIDEPAFWAEHRQILQEFVQYWDGYTPVLQKSLEAETKQENNKWFGHNTHGFREWVLRA